jgi:hypothetical protein
VKFDLAKMLAEIKHDEPGGEAPPRKRVLTQDEIKAMARKRRKAAPPSDK